MIWNKVPYLHPYSFSLSHMHKSHLYYIYPLKYTLFGLALYSCGKFIKS